MNKTSDISYALPLAPSQVGQQVITPVEKMLVEVQDKMKRMGEEKQKLEQQVTNTAMQMAELQKQIGEAITSKNQAEQQCIALQQQLSQLASSAAMFRNSDQVSIQALQQQLFQEKDINTRLLTELENNSKKLAAFEFQKPVYEQEMHTLQIQQQEQIMEKKILQEKLSSSEQLVQQNQYELALSRQALDKVSRELAQVKIQQPPIVEQVPVLAKTASAVVFPLFVPRTVYAGSRAAEKALQEAGYEQQENGYELKLLCSNAIVYGDLTKECHLIEELLYV